MSSQTPPSGVPAATPASALSGLWRDSIGSEWIKISSYCSFPQSKQYIPCQILSQIATWTFWITKFELQDYARLHNYNVLTPCTLADPTLSNMWNKIGWLIKAMQVPACLMTLTGSSISPGKASCKRTCLEIRQRLQYIKTRFGLLVRFSLRPVSIYDICMVSYS